MKRTRLMSGALLSFVIGVSAVGQPPPLPPPDAERVPTMKERLADASMVLVGEVVSVGGATFAEVPRDASTIVIRVTRVLESDSELTPAEGAAVTVLTDRRDGLAPGTHATFYVAPWISGDGLAVREIWREAFEAPPRDEEIEEVRARVDAARIELRQEDIRFRLERADAAFIGRVRSVRPVLAMNAERPRFTEHDPMWHEAIVQVEEGFKNAAEGDQVAVRFPASRDVMWFRVPKPRIDERAVFLLRKDDVSKASEPLVNDRAVPAFAASSRGEIVSLKDAELVRRIAKPEERPR